MNTFECFMMGQANRGKEQKVFDWDKAARLIKEKQPALAMAGLIEDWGWTGGTIWEEGKPDYERRTYLASTWATPTLIVDGEEIDCYRMASKVPEWGAETKWPVSALKILGLSQV